MLAYLHTPAVPHKDGVEIGQPIPAAPSGDRAECITNEWVQLLVPRVQLLVPRVYEAKENNQDHTPPIASDPHRARPTGCLTWNRRQ